jgi:pimeloyl-ACP methyl ester carboxylesterase
VVLGLPELARRAPRKVRMFADLTDVLCYYELRGSGDPLVLIPGLGSTCALWDSVAADLAKSFCLILLDHRGVGRSIPKHAPRTLEDFAIDLVELMDYLQLDRAHVMGLSLGGMIAYQLALDHASRIDRLVLVSCTNRFAPYLREVVKFMTNAFRYFPQDVFLRTVKLLGTGPEYLDAHPDAIDKKIATANENAIPRSAVARQLSCLVRHDRDEGLGYPIVAPTLVIAGEQDNLIPACYARRMAQQIHRSEFMLVPGCGHNPFVEKPELVLPHITEFLMRRQDLRRSRQGFQAAREASV